VLSKGIEKYGVSGNILLFFLFAFYDKKKKGKKLNKGAIWEKGNLSNCQSLVRGRMPLPAGVRVRTIEGNNKQAEEKAAPGQISGIMKIS
jgi:hypothetical protein